MRYWKIFGKIILVILLVQQLYNLLYTIFRGGSCSMADGCFYKEDADSIQKIFTQVFYFINLHLQCCGERGWVILSDHFK